LNDKYTDNAKLFAALADVNRLMIVDMLSCKEMCACRILERFNITQPTLSHHMRILCGCGLVNSRREGKWMYYSLDERTVQGLKEFLVYATSRKEDCICAEPLCNCTER